MVDIIDRDDDSFDPNGDRIKPRFEVVKGSPDGRGRRPVRRAPAGTADSLPLGIGFCVGRDGVSGPVAAAHDSTVNDEGPYPPHGYGPPRYTLG